MRESNLKPAVERKFLETLHRRYEFLARRVHDEPNRNGISFDKSELAALTWALHTLDDDFVPKTFGKIQ